MNIKLHGILGQQFGNDFHFKTNTISEALRAIQANTGSFFNFLKKKDTEGIHYKVVIGSDKDAESIPPEEISLKSGLYGKTVHIIPVIQGAENLQAILNIIIGIILVVAGAVTGNPWLIVAGAMMIIGGIMQLVTKPPKPPAPGRTPSSITTTSFVFQGPIQVMKQGIPVPLAYGQMKCGSSVLSTAYRSTSYYSEYDVLGFSERTGTAKDGSPVFSTSEKKSNFLPAAGDGSYPVPVHWNEKTPRYGNASKIIGPAQRGNTYDEKSAPETPPGGPLIFPSWSAYLSGMSTMFNLKEIGGKLYFVDNDGIKIHESLSVSSDTPSNKQKAIENWLAIRGYKSGSNKIPTYESGSEIVLGGEKVKREGPPPRDFMPRHLSASYNKTRDDEERETYTFESMSLRWNAPSSSTKKVTQYVIHTYPIMQYQYIIAFNKESASKGGIWAVHANISNRIPFFEIDFVQNNLDHSSGSVVQSNVLTSKEFCSIANRSEKLGLAFDGSSRYTEMFADTIDHSIITNYINSNSINVDHIAHFSTSPSLTLDGNSREIKWLSLNPSKTNTMYSDVTPVLYGDNSGLGGEEEMLIGRQTEIEAKIDIPLDLRNQGILTEKFYAIDVTKPNGTLMEHSTISGNFFRPNQYETDTTDDRYKVFNTVEGKLGLTGSVFRKPFMFKTTRNYKIYMEPIFMVAFSVKAKFEDGSESVHTETVFESSDFLKVNSPAKDSLEESPHFSR